MSEDRFSSPAAKEFITKLRASEAQLMEKMSLQKYQDQSFIHMMITDLDSICQCYRGNKEIIGEIIKQIKKALSPPEGVAEDETYSRIRYEYLEFLSKFPWFENLGEHCIEFFDILCNIVINDNEENAQISLHTILNFNKYFKKYPISIHYRKPLLDFFNQMLKNFDEIVESTFSRDENQLDSKYSPEKPAKTKRPSKDSLNIVNEFMELVIFLDNMYKDDAEQEAFFKEFKDPFIYALAKGYDLKWLKNPHQTKIFFSLKEECNSKVYTNQNNNIIDMLILNIKQIPSSYWTVKRQLMIIFKEFLIKISKRAEEANPQPDADNQDNVFIHFKDKILDPAFIAKHCDNNIEIFKEFSYLIIEFSIRYLKVVDKNYDKCVIEAILQLLRHPHSYPVEKIECAAEYFMRLTILSIQKDDKAQENNMREKTFFHNEIVEAICDASLERAEHLYNFGVREEEMKTFDETEDDEVHKTSEDMDVDVDPENYESFLDMDYEFMAYSKIKSIGKAKDVFERDDNFPFNTYSK